MPRYSGYDGQISIQTAGGTLTGPVQSFVLDIQQDEWEQGVKSDDFAEFAFGGKSWTAELTFLIDTAVVAATHDMIGDEVTALTLKYDSGGAKLWTMNTTDKGVVQSVVTSSPLDGPAEWNITVRGKGAIAFTGV